MEKVNEPRQNFLSLSELQESSPTIDKVSALDKRDEDWKNANSLFKRRFRYCLRPQIFRSLIM